MSDPIRISRDELNAPQVDEVLSREAVYRGSWGDGGDGEEVGKVKRRGGASGKGKGLYLHGVLLTGFLAMLGALGGWAIVEPFVDEDTGEGGILLGLGMIPLVIGLSGGLLSLSDGLLSRAWGRAFTSGAIGLGIGLVGGMVMTFVAGIFYVIGQGVTIGFGNSIDPLPNTNNIADYPFWFFMGNMSARAAAWSLFGLVTGVAPGLLQKSRDLITVGILGGMIGGFLGGLFFDPISVPGNSGELSRMIGFGFLGLTTGTAIGLVEQLSKDAWLYMEAGPLVGKQFVLYKDPTKVGSSPKCDIFVFKDPDISPEHAYLRRVGGAHEIEAVGQAPVIINGKRVGRQRLEDGDQIRIGKACFRYYVRKKKRKAIR